MSRRRRPPEDPPEEPPALLEDPEDWLDEDVEYFVLVDEEDWVSTSVPKSAQSSQTSISAPSTFTVFGFETSLPHISHWAMGRDSRGPRLKCTPVRRAAATPRRTAGPR